MKIRALVVTDKIEDRNNKEGKSIRYRTLSVVDQDESGPTLESMAQVSINPEDSRAGSSLVGSVVNISVRNIQDDWRGLSFRGDLLSVEGTMRFVPAKAA